MTSSQPQLPARYAAPAFVAEGAFGRVYRAELSAGPVAVKVLTGPADAEATWRFTAEARRLAGLSHPAFPGLVEQGVTEAGSPFYAMTYLPGRAPGLMGPDAARAVLARVAEALVYLHARGLVHGDLKAENVLVDGDRVSVLDVGMARAVGDRRAAVEGTLEYAAPEVLRLADVAPEADWYAFGVLAYVFLAGHTPFSADGGPGALVRRQLMDRPPALSTPDAALAGAVMSLLEKEPRDRDVAGMLALLGVASEPAERGLAPAAWQPRGEIAAAWAVLEPGGIVALQGPAGAGKSHALDALRLEATLAGGTWLVASCAGAGAAPGSVARLLLRQGLSAARLEANPALQDWLSGRIPAAWGDLEPRARKLALQSLLGDAWAAVAARAGRPWVGLDDWDRVDATSRELIEQLQGIPATAGWCLAGGEAPAGAEVITLAPWTPDEVAGLVASRLGTPAPDALLQALAAVDASLPQLVNALLDHWYTGGALVREGEAWKFTPSALAGGGETPWDALWREKLDRLPVEARRLAGVLAAFGVDLPAWALGQALASSDEALQGQIDALVREGVVSLGEGGLHLASLPPSVQLPAPDDAPALATRLARLLEAHQVSTAAALALRGQDAELALGLAIAAARQAFDNLALDDASRLLTAARERLTDAVAPARRLEVQLATAEVARFLDRKDEAMAAFGEALALAEATQDARSQAIALTGLAKGHQIAGRYDEGLALARRAMDAADAARAPGLGARAAMVVARIQVFHGALGEARAACQRAAALAEAGHAPLIRANALNLLGVLVVQDAPEQREEGLAAIHESLALTRAAGDRIGTIGALENLGNAHLAVGELREAESAFEQAAVICQESRVTAEGLSADMNLALVRAELGQAEAAHALAADVVARAESLGRAFIRAIALAVQGQAAWRMARFDEAFRALEEAIAAVLAIKNRFAEEYIRLYRLEAFLAAGLLEAAREEAQAAAEVVAHTQHAEGRHRLALYQARLALAEGRGEEAIALAEPLLRVDHLALAHGAHHVLAAAGRGADHLNSARSLSALWQAPWHLSADELALAHAAQDPNATLAHARAALAAPNLFAQAGAACLLAAHGQHEAAGRTAVHALLTALPADLRDTVLAAQGLPAAAVLEELAAAPRAEASPAFAAWLARVMDASDERAINEAVLEATLALVQAQRGYLIEYERGRLVQVVTLGLDYDTELAQGFSASIVEEVLLTGEPVYSFDAAADARWSASASVHALDLHTVVALPYGTARRLLGVVYVDRPTVEPILGDAELQALDLLARAGAERVAALRLAQEFQAELAFEREVSRAALAMARAADEAGRRAAVLDAALRLSGAERAFWLSRADEGWTSLAAQDVEGRPLAYQPGTLPTSVLARAAEERDAICLVESDEPEGWTPGQSVLALGLRMIWCVPTTPDARELLYLDTQKLTAVDPQGLTARLNALQERLLTQGESNQREGQSPERDL